MGHVEVSLACVPERQPHVNVNKNNLVEANGLYNTSLRIHSTATPPTILPDIKINSQNLLPRLPVIKHQTPRLTAS